MPSFIRPLPALEPRTEAFWRACRAGRLEFTRCIPCGHFIHPSKPICPKCRGRQLEVAAVSGSARLHSYTINHQRWYPGQEVPYVIGLVELVEQPGLRLMTNVINCPLDRVRIDMPLRVVFENLSGDVALPLFEPVEPSPWPSPASSAGEGTARQHPTSNGGDSDE